MSPKATAKKAAPAKKAPSKPVAQMSAKKADKKSLKETVSKNKKQEAAAAVVPGAEVDAEELEEQQDAASFQASGSGEALAAAATTTTEATSLSFKNFRHHPEMENFYRFIYENDLRYEALGVIDQIMTQKQTLKVALKQKSQPH